MKIVLFGHLCLEAAPRLMRWNVGIGTGREHVTLFGAGFYHYPANKSAGRTFHLTLPFCRIQVW